MSNSNFIYGLFLFTSANVIYSFIKVNIKNNNKEISNTILHVNDNIINEFNNLYKKINNINIDIDSLNHKLNSVNTIMNNIDIKFNELSLFMDVKKIDKSTSTIDLSVNISKDILSNQDFYTGDAILIESDADIIDDVYDYLPCQNFKKHTVYDIILHNLTK